MVAFEPEIISDSPIALRSSRWIVPAKLKAGDEVAIVAPSFPAGIIEPERQRLASFRFHRLGLRLKLPEAGDDDIDSKVVEFHRAFSDSQFQGVMAMIGGWTGGALLKRLDYDLIQSNPKVFCGFSDTTILLNAIHARTGLVTYYGPNVANFSMLKGLDYSLDMFARAVMNSEPFLIPASLDWSDDEWHLNQRNRILHPNHGSFAIQEGTASGIIVAGQLSSLCCLFGTGYCPSFLEKILFLEEHPRVTAPQLQKLLISLANQESFQNVRGLVFGRFGAASGITESVLGEVIRGIPEFCGIPVLAGVDFGHTVPQCTLPIGGEVRICSSRYGSLIEILVF